MNNSSNKFLYTKGAEWRKWDLHIHTKVDRSYKYSSNVNISQREQNDSEYPKVFVEHLYSIPNLGAIAITDHNSAFWIDKIIEENNAFTLPNGRKERITILPGVEIESSDGIHLLVIFNPQTQLKDARSNYRKKTWKETIEHFLTAIEITQGNNSSKTTEQIMEEAEKWDALCIFAHVKFNKGFFKISSGASKTRIYKHRLTQIFQLSRGECLEEGQQKIVDGMDNNYCGDNGIPKPICCITSSDAKSLEEVGRANLWIKADPTFEGLKQIVYERQERIYIGEEPPRKIERNKIIKAITISNSNNWFEDKTMLLNEGLISVIGGKGSGKTAILDLIAYASGSYKSYEDDASKSKSFLKKAFKELRGTNVKIEWDDGSFDEKQIVDNLEVFTNEGKVRYLPQDYVDQLCSELGHSELEKQIEDVIFQKIPEEYKANFTDFNSYKETQITVIKDRKNRIKNQINNINNEIFTNKRLINQKCNKQKEKQNLENDKAQFEKEKQNILNNIQDSNNQKQIISQLENDKQEKSKLEKQISELNTNILKIGRIKNNILRFLEDIEKFIESLKSDLKEVGVKTEIINLVELKLTPKNLISQLDDRNDEINQEIKRKQNELQTIKNKINELEKEIKLETTKHEKIKEIDKKISELNNRIESLKSELAKIENAESRLPELIKARDDLFINYFELIFEEKEKLKEIYTPLESILKTSGEENEKLFDFTVQFKFDINSMAKEGHELIDLRAEGKFRQTKSDALKEELDKIKFNLTLENSKISDADRESIINFLANVKKLFTEGNKDISSQLKEKYSELDFDNWLYSTDYYNINYSIKFNNIDLANLSPGLKGVALLILFLELDQEDNRPILIDQPEENLDNRSIYNTLVKYFRSAKKRRQVIIVTHNANLVVNTDSEQVIVANFDKERKNQISKIKYVSGSLENTFKDETATNVLEKQGIREHVCEILEGGKLAFELREKKYGFR